ncbi:MAG: glycosyltransferase family 39 protein [Patescibacteria group bacterium]
MKKSISISNLRKQWFLFAVISIILLATVLRFANYSERFGLAYDQAHDALIAHYAVTSYQLPLLGPFSSAGPFQTGGEWYWLIMSGTVLAPQFLLSPWIFITSLSVLFVYLMILVGKEIAGKQFAILAGFLAAVSPGQINQSTNLTNQSPQSLFAVLAIWFALLFLHQYKLRYAFLLGLTIGIASSIHLSGVALGSLAVGLLCIFLFVEKKIPYRAALLVILGVVLPWIPVLLVDLQHHFFNFGNMIQYYLHDQHNISLDVLGRRWLTYLGVFWPTEWAFIIGGFPWVGYLIGVSFLSFIFLRKFVKKEIVILLISLAIMIGLLRYTHTPIFTSYLVFTHPFVLLITAWIIFMLWRKQVFVGAAFFALLVASSLWQDYQIISTAQNQTAHTVEKQIQALEARYPNKKFAVYTYQGKWNDKNYSLALFLVKRGLLDDNGIKVSTVIATQVPELKKYVFFGPEGDFQLVAVPKLSAKEFEQKQWKQISDKQIYKETEEWFYHKDQP